MGVAIDDWMHEKIRLTLQSIPLAAASDKSGSSSPFPEEKFYEVFRSSGSSVHEFVDAFAAGPFAEGMTHVGAAIAGAYQRLKHDCLYIDSATPQELVLAVIGSEENIANEWLARARACLQITKHRSHLAAPIWALIDALGKPGSDERGQLQ